MTVNLRYVLECLILIGISTGCNALKQGVIPENLNIVVFLAGKNPGKVSYLSVIMGKLWVEMRDEGLNK